MAHSANYISSVKLPGSNTVYEIHDANAIHDPADLGLHGALIFKGILTAESNLPTAAATNVGHVYLIGATEYVCVEVAGTTTTYKWEKLGNIHDAASSTHTHNVTVGGKNAASAVTGKVTVPTVTPTTETVGGTAAAQSITLTKDNVLGEATTFSTTITGSGLGTVTKQGIKASGVASVSKSCSHPNTEWLRPQLKLTRRMFLCSLMKKYLMFYNEKMLSIIDPTRMQDSVRRQTGSDRNIQILPGSECAA